MGRLPSKTRCGTSQSGVALGLRPARRVLPNASASVCANTFAISRSWWSPERVERLREADEVARDQPRALVDQLVEGVLAVGARLAPEDRPGVVARRARPSSVTGLPLLSMSSCCR